MARRRDPHPFKMAADGQGDGTSERVITRHLKNVGIQIDGTFQADVSVQTRLAPALSFIEITQVSGPALVPIPNDMPVYDVQLVVTNYVSGEIEGLLVGRTSQE